MNKGERGFFELVGNRIMEARVRAGLLQSDLADMLSLNKVQISNIEKGVSGTTLENLYKMSIILDRPIAWFFPTKDQYKPKFKAPAPIKPNRKGPNRRRLLLAMENASLKDEVRSLENQLESYMQGDI